MARADDLVLLRRLQAGVRRGSRQIRALSVTWGLPSPGRPFSEARARQRRHDHRRSPTDRQHGHALKSLSPTPERRPPTLIRSEEHKYELQSLMRISYAVCSLKKKT